MLMLPKNLKKYFWDIDFEKLDLNKYPHFVIERILEYGDKETINWMMKQFKKSQIRQTLTKTKGLTKKSANYWSSILAVPKNKISCLSKSYQKMQKSHWPY